MSTVDFPSKCPMLSMKEGYPEEVPAYCLAKCESRWRAAISNGNGVGKYEIYNYTGNGCEHTGDLASTDGALVMISRVTRQYVSVDECVDCKRPYGEIGYEFQCTDTEPQAEIEGQLALLQDEC